MYLGLTQKVALVTGASAGIGYTVAQKLVAILKG
jgi:3-oxoacyl-[acyl-carrier protein] reductase